MHTNKRVSPHQRHATFTHHLHITNRANTCTTLHTTCSCSTVFQHVDMRVGKKPLHRAVPCVHRNNVAFSNTSRERTEHTRGPQTHSATSLSCHLKHRHAGPSATFSFFTRHSGTVLATYRDVVASHFAQAAGSVPPTLLTIRFSQSTQADSSQAAVAVVAVVGAASWLSAANDPRR